MLSRTLKKLSLFIILGSSSALAQEVPVVTLGALNKITAKLESSCQSNPPEETPESVAFIEVVDYGQTNVATEIFKGWMFASSPAISALEHAVYDVWVTDCKMVDPSASSDIE